MKRWTRRCLFSLSLVIAAAALLFLIGLSLLRATPAWYAPARLAAAERQQLAQSAENKLIETQNWAAQLRADAVRRARAAEAGATRPATRAADAHVVQFTQDELNALFEKWSVMHGWSSSYRAHLESPALILRDGRIILAGRVIDLGAVVSAHFRPSLSDDGDLRLDLVKVRGGRLPLPDAFWRHWREQARRAVRENMPRWQRQSRIASNGAANTDALAAAMGQLFLRITAQQGAEPVLFLPLADGGDSVPVKLTAVEVSEGTLQLAVIPLTAPERRALLSSIRAWRD